MFPRASSARGNSCGYTLIASTMRVPNATNGKSAASKTLRRWEPNRVQRSAFSAKERMSNPLLRPNDPRFQKPEVRDIAGKNRFGESTTESPPPASDSVYSAATTSDEARPFVPRYEVQQHSRPTILFILA